MFGQVASSNAQHEYFDKFMILPHKIADASIVNFLCIAVHLNATTNWSVKGSIPSKPQIEGYSIVFI